MLRVYFWCVASINYDHLVRIKIAQHITKRIGRREKRPKKSWEEGEIGGKSREEGEKET